MFVKNAGLDRTEWGKTGRPCGLLGTYLGKVFFFFLIREQYKLKRSQFIYELQHNSLIYVTEFAHLVFFWLSNSSSNGEPFLLQTRRMDLDKNRKKSVGLG